MNTAHLDRRVTLQQRTVTRDPATGAQLPATWATVDTVFAQVLESSTATGLSDGAPAGLATAARPTRVRMRWWPGINRTDWRLQLDNGQLLRIVGVAEMGRRAGLELACNEWSHE